MPKCLIALGGNLQISPHVFRDAIAQLQLLGCSDLQMSSVLKTRPVGVDAGHEFLNAAAVLQTDLSPDALLRTLHEIEAKFHRTRTCHWGPRTLDLDLILHGDRISNIPPLVVPHPAMWYRRFVLEPAIEVAADMVHPTLHESVAGLHQLLMRRPLRLEICLAGPSMEIRMLEEIMHQLQETGGGATEWYPTDSSAVIGSDTFARIVVRHGKNFTTSQPLNRKYREIEIGGATMSEVFSQIEHLKIAMLG